jgi:ribonuclease PH
MPGAVGRRANVAMLSDIAVRTDGRTPAMMRQMHMERDCLERATGSARWEQGASSPPAAPRQPSRRRTNERVIESSDRS